MGRGKQMQRVRPAASVRRADRDEKGSLMPSSNARLLVVSAAARSALESALADATHRLTDTAGERVNISTIDGRTLQTAVRTALAIATGEIIVFSDERLIAPSPKAPEGVFHHA